MRPIDALTLQYLAAELDVKLAGGKVNKIQQASYHEILLHIWVGGQAGRQKLYINIKPQYAFCTLVEDSAFLTFPQKAPAFSMLLRKHLEMAKIERIDTPPDERVLNLHCTNVNELGQHVRLVLSMELMGKHSNIILYDPEINMILGCAHGVSEAMSRHRELAAGYPYQPPPTAAKPVLRFVPPDDVIATITHTLANPASDPAKAMAETYAGISSAIWRDVFSHTHDPKAAYALIRELYSGTHLYPALSDDGKHFSLLSCHADKAGWAGQPSIQAMIQAYYRHHFIEDQLHNARHALEQVLKVQAKKLNERMKQLDKHDDASAQALKISGDLLTLAHSQNLVPVKNHVELIDPSTGKTHRIEIDPTLSLSENAQAYYKRYKKTMGRLQSEADRRAELTDMQAFLDEVHTELHLAQSTADISAVREDLEAAGWMKPKASIAKDKRKKTSEPMRLKSSDGLTLLVGRNGLQNDQIVGKLSRPEDIWLHTHQIPGSHVLIKTDKTTVPDQTLLEAAMLAVYFSQGRDSANVPVVYTEARYVRKIPASYPGHVTYTHEQAVHVTVELSTVQALCNAFKETRL